MDENPRFGPKNVDGLFFWWQPWLTAPAGVGGPRGDVRASSAVASPTLEGLTTEVDSVNGKSFDVDAEDTATQVSPFLSTDAKKT